MVIQKILPKRYPADNVRWISKQRRVAITACRAKEDFQQLRCYVEKAHYVCGQRPLDIEAAACRYYRLPR